VNAKISLCTDDFMKKTILLTILLGMALSFSLLFTGCDNPTNRTGAVPKELAGEWNGQDTLGSPVSITISGNTIILDGAGKGSCEVRDGTIIYRPTHIYDPVKNQFVDATAYIAALKKEYLDLWHEQWESGDITKEQYDEAAAHAETMFAIPETEIIPYRLEGGKLFLTLALMGEVVLTRK
jgi:hypothetical protein